MLYPQIGIVSSFIEIMLTLMNFDPHIYHKFINIPYPGNYKFQNTKKGGGRGEAERQTDRQTEH